MAAHREIPFLNKKTLVVTLLLTGWTSHLAWAAPTISITTPTNGATVSGTVTVTVSASGFGNLTKVDFWRDGAKQVTDTVAPWAWSWNTTLTTTGSHSLYARGYDASTKKWTKSATITVTVMRADTTPPTGSVTINSGAAYTNATTVTLTLSASDPDTGVTQMQFSNDNVTYSTPESYATSKSWTLEAGDGLKTVYAQFQNGQGLWSSAASDTVTLDTILPAAPMINPVTTPTSQTSQTLTGTKEANTGVWLGGSAVVALSAATNWSYTASLSEGDNAFTLTAKDAAGNDSVTSAPVMITRDTTPPPPPTINAPATPTSQPTQTLSGTRTVEAVTITPSSAMATFGVAGYPTATTWEVTVTLAEGNNVIEVRAADDLGNTSSPSSTTILYDPNLDPNPPTGTLSINDGALYAPDATVTLTLRATDQEGPVTQMQFSNDNVAYSAPEPYAITKSWTLSAGDGDKTVYAQFQDAASNWSAPASDAILLDTTPPTIRITEPQDQQIITGQ